MKVGLFMPFGTANASAALLTAAGEAAEERGFESLWVAEHVVMFDEYDSRYPYAESGRFPGAGDSGLIEPFTALTFIAAVTKTVRLGTGICLVPQRNPVYTAKAVADLDVLSGGRVDFGVGVGWLREEFEAVSAPFERRGQRCDEYLTAMKSMWTDPVSEYHGELYDLRPCQVYPKPVQQPHPPIHVGGESAAALRRVAAHAQGWYSFNRLPDQLDEPLARLDPLLAQAGRSRADIELTVCPYFNEITPAMIEGYAAHGVDRLVALCFAFSRDDLLTTMDALATNVLQPASG
jgi:probable F420-dependent oxidoreductase